jgi:hypothetical protein
MGTELVRAEGGEVPMNRPSGVRAAETMTTGSEVVAMAVILNVCVSGRGASLNDIYHMMRRGICNGGSG